MFTALSNPANAANDIRPSRTPRRCLRELPKPQKRKKRERQNICRAPGVCILAEFRFSVR
jgi:hypothetical protein